MSGWSATLPNWVCLSLHLDNGFYGVEQSSKLYGMFFFLPTLSLYHLSMSTMNTDTLHKQGSQWAADFVKSIFGWQQNPSAVIQAATMFQTGWMSNSTERRQTRTLALNIVQDVVSQILIRTYH